MILGSRHAYPGCWKWCNRRLIISINLVDLRKLIFIFASAVKFVVRRESTTLTDFIGQGKAFLNHPYRQRGRGVLRQRGKKKNTSLPWSLKPLALNTDQERKFVSRHTV